MPSEETISLAVSPFSVDVLAFYCELLMCFFSSLADRGVQFIYGLLRLWLSKTSICIYVYQQEVDRYLA